LTMLKLALATVLFLSPACAPDPEPAAPLNAEERLLVDAYVRLSLLEALRVETPDSVESVLDSLSAAWDSTRMVERIQMQQAQPYRWEKIYTAITAELNQLERYPDNYWKAVRRPELHAPMPSIAPDSSASTPE
jgi:hypothetical protein